MTGGLSFTSRDLAGIDAANQRAALYAQRQDTDQIAARVSEIHQTHPHLAAPVVMSLAENKAPPAVVDRAAVLQVKKDARDEGGTWWGNALSKVLEGAQRGVPAPGFFKAEARTLMNAANYPVEIVQAGSRDVIEAARRAGGFATEMAANPTGSSLGSSATPALRPALSGGKPGIATAATGVTPAGDPNQSLPSQLSGQTRLGASFQLADETQGSAWDKTKMFFNSSTNLPPTPPDGDPATVLEQAGQSWFPGLNSLAEKRQVANARDASMTGGHVTTFGRAAASAVGLEPGTRAYNLVSGPLDIPIYAADPTAYVGGVAAKAGKARRVLGGDGKVVEHTVTDVQHLTASVRPKSGGAAVAHDFLVESPRKTVIFEDAARQLAADEMRPTWEGMAKTRGGHVPVTDEAGNVVGFHDPTGYGGDFDRLRRSQPNMPIESLLAILDEPTAEGVQNIIGQGMARDFMDTGLGKVANPNSARYTYLKPRMLHNRVSEPTLSRQDPNGSLDQFDRWQNVLRKGAGKDVFTQGVMSANNEAMARELVSAVGNPAAVPVAVTQTLKATLVAHGIEPGKANQVLEIFTNAATAERHFAIDGATGTDRHLKTVVIDGLETQAPSPHLSAEMFDESFTLPAPAPILRALSVARKVTATAGWEDVVAFGDMFNMAFKTGALGFRPVAFALRNVMEAQARIATDGLDGIYNSPASLTAWLAGHDRTSKFSRAVAKAGVPARGAGDLVDDDLLKAATEAADATVFGRTLESGAGPYADPKAVLTGNHTVVRRSAGDVWLEAHRFQLAKLASSPEVRMVARDGATPATKQWFWETGLRQKMATRRPELLDRQGADKYLDGIQADLMTDYGKNPKLIQAIAHNTLDDIPLNVRDPATGRLKPGKGVIKALRGMEADLPEFAVSAQTMDASRGQGQLVRGAVGMERLLERVMEFSGTKPDNFFDRSPVFRQILWNNILRTSALADPAEKAGIVARARSNHLPTAFVKKLEQTEFRGTLTRKEVNELASVRARRDTLKLLYDSHDQQNWTNTLRMVQPFAAAMQDQYRVWGRLLKQNPMVLHRVEQGWHAGHQSGFLYADPATGQERFAMPGSRAFAGLLGLPEDAMSGSTTQANLITSGLVPGFGPAITQPASMLIPKDPDWDPVRQLLTPYGPEDGGLVGRLGPSWLDKAWTATAAMTGREGVVTPKQRRMLLNSVADAQKYLASTGNYDQSDPADMERLAKDARSKGAQMLLLRALVQANAPASPTYEVAVKDKDGKLTSALWLAGKYRKFLAEDKDTADYKMLSTYGEASFYAFTGNTEGVTGATEAGRALVVAHPEVARSYPDVWALFTDPDSPFSFDEYNRQLNAAGGGKISPEKVQVKAQTGLAWATYRQYKEQVDPFPDQGQKDWLATVKEKIRGEFPLWDDSFDAQKAKRAVTQVRAAVQSPALRDTDAAKGAAIYLTYRDQLVAADLKAHEAGASSYKTPFRAKDAAAQRVWLRQVADAVTKQHPGFAPIFEKVFAREMIDDTEPVTEPADG
jgi:hypothetical protein